MAGCCSCCSALRPRYKRLVDNIFPAIPQDGLVRNNMEKLIFYALSSPEKLDRIGEYLSFKVSRDISRHRQGFVFIAMEAMDQLLIACHAQSLNLFVESFLKMVQKLLECHESEMQLLATQSFIKFANIEEDTPSYHRRYDFFVSKFSSLCHNDNDDLDTRNRLRVAGLKGIQGVVRKTVSDDLQVNIWDETHMEKIIPSLIYNMQGHTRSSTETPDSPHEEGQPYALAENCFRELMGRATFGNIRSVVRPVLKHLDNHQLWVPNDFAIRIFKIIMYSTQAQYSYSVIQILMCHLDEKSRIAGVDKKRKTAKADAKVLTGIVNVLSHIVSITAGESIGPSVLEIFNSLLNHLRHSIDVRATTSDENDEKEFQESVINTLGEFANNLPDFQKIEIMMFIMGKVPLPMDQALEVDVLLQKILLKSLLMVGTKYRTVQMSQAFPSSFLQPLLQMSLAPDPAVRIVVQQILQTLLDRHDNLELVARPRIGKPFMDLKIAEKSLRQDLMFFKKNGPEIMLHLYEAIVILNNTAGNYAALYTTMSLILLEFGSDDEALVELLRLVFTIQEVTVKLTTPSPQSLAVHSFIASFFHLMSHLTDIEAFCDHVDMKNAIRTEKAPHLLPDENGNFIFSDKNLDAVQEEFLFDRTVVSDAFRNCGRDSNRNIMTPYVPRRMSIHQVTVTRSSSDLASINVEVDSVNSSPGIPRRHPEEEITVESLKKMMAEPRDAHKQAADERRLRIIEEFRTAPFEELVAKAEQQTTDLQHKLNEIFGKVPAAVDITRPNSPHPNNNNREEQHRPAMLTAPVHNIRFPDHFVY